MSEGQRGLLTLEESPLHEVGVHLHGGLGSWTVSELGALSVAGLELNGLAWETESWKMESDRLVLEAKPAWTDPVRVVSSPGEPLPERLIVAWTTGTEREAQTAAVPPRDRQELSLNLEEGRVRLPQPFDANRTMWIRSPEGAWGLVERDRLPEGVVVRPGASLDLRVPVSGDLPSARHVAVVWEDDRATFDLRPGSNDLLLQNLPTGAASLELRHGSADGPSQLLARARVDLFPDGVSFEGWDRLVPEGWNAPALNLIARLPEGAKAGGMRFRLESPSPGSESYELPARLFLESATGTCTAQLKTLEPGLWKVTLDPWFETMEVDVPLEGEASVELIARENARLEAWPKQADLEGRRGNPPLAWRACDSSPWTYVELDPVLDAYAFHAPYGEVQVLRPFGPKEARLQTFVVAEPFQAVSL